MSSGKNTSSVVWSGKPWIAPSLIIRSVAVIVITSIVLFLEYYMGVLNNTLLIMPAWFLTDIVFGILWLAAVFGLLILRASHTYILRQEGLEVKRGILRLQTFIVTPQGFGDLLVNQSVAGRILNYGDLIVDSQGEKKTRLQLVHRPNYVVDQMREIMGKPIVRIEQIPQTVSAR